MQMKSFQWFGIFILPLLFTSFGLKAQNTGLESPVLIQPEESTLQELQRAFDTLKYKSIRPAERLHQV